MGGLEAYIPFGTVRTMMCVRGFLWSLLEMGIELWFSRIGLYGFKPSVHAFRSLGQL